MLADPLSYKVHTLSVGDCSTAECSAIELRGVTGRTKKTIFKCYERYLISALLETVSRS
jgi:hypothetical protein